jgi:translational activator of cytochrome c oxidase 1
MQNLRRFCQLQFPVFITGELTGRSSRVIINCTPFYRNAGHSKWHNIRHTKGAKDLERSKQIIKYHSRLQLAIREGGGLDPKNNSALNSVLQDAKSQKLPMSSIQKLLDSITKNKSQDQQNEVWPLKGPGRAIILVEVFTDNRAKVKNDLNTVLKKNKGQWTEGSAIKLFECNGVIQCSNFKGSPPTEAFLEEATDHAIEAGANDVTLQEVEEHGMVYEFTTAASGIHKIKGVLTGIGYECVSSEVIYSPKTRIELDDDDLKGAAQLCDKILEHPEVVNVYDNIQ